MWRVSTECTMKACGHRFTLLAVVTFLVVGVTGVVDEDQLKVIGEGDGQLLEDASTTEGDQVEGDVITQRTDTFLAALLRLEEVLNVTHGCDTRLEDLWQEITIRRLTLERLQEEVFRLMNQYAKVQAQDPAAEVCPEPFETDGGGCFYHPHGEKKTWAEARYSCFKIGGDLAYPDDLTSFKEYVKRFASGEGGFFFLGGRTDPKLEFPEYRWVDGRNIPSEDNMSSEPSTLGNDHCVAIEAYNLFQIQAAECDSHKRWYICEIKVKRPSAAQPV